MEEKQKRKEVLYKQTTTRTTFNDNSDNFINKCIVIELIFEGARGNFSGMR